MITLSNYHSYLLFHSFAEFFSIIISITIFLLAWNSKKFVENDFFLFIGISFLFVGIIDFIHLLSYKGMDVFVGLPYASVQLWIAARYMQSLSILTAFLFISDKRKVNTVILLLTYSFISIMIILSIFYWKNFPACFIENSGLTPFKKISEYIIAFIYLINTLLLNKFKNSFNSKIYKLLNYSFILGGITELTFSSYSSVFDKFNIIGHYFKILSFYFFYLAIIEKGIKDPQQIIFRKLSLDHEKQKEKEILYNQITETIRSTLDINNLKTIIVTEIGKFFDADRCAIIQYDNINNKFSAIDNLSEYISDDSLDSHITFDIEEGELSIFKNYFLKEKQELLLPDIDNPPFEFNQQITTILKNLKLKSNYTVLITYGDEFLGVLYLNYVKHKRVFSVDEINFLRNLSNQSGIALYQASLYSREKNLSLMLTKSFKKEKFLRQLMLASMDSKTAEESLTTIVTKTCKFFKADRCFYLEYDSTTDVFLRSEPYQEYNDSPNFKKLSDRPYTQEESAPFVEFAIRQRKTFLVKNIYETFLPGAQINVMEEYGIKSLISCPVFYHDIPLGMLAVHAVNDFREFTQEEVDLLVAVASQAAISIYQSKLIKKEKQAAEQEIALRKAIEISKNQQDALLDSIPYLAWIKDEKGKYLAVNKGFADSAFKKAEEIIGKTDYEVWPEEFAKNYIADDIKVMRTGKNIIVEEQAEYHGNIRWTETCKAPVFNEEGTAIGTAGIARDITSRKQELIELTESRNRIIEANKREQIIKNITTLIRSELDIKKIKKFFISEISKYLDSDFNIFYEQDIETQKFLTIDEDSFYLSSLEIKSPLGVNIFEDYGWSEFFRKNPIEIIYSNINDFKKDYNLYGGSGEKFIDDYNIKSSIVIPVIHSDQLLGVLAINYTKKQKHITEDDLNFVRVLANQSGVALYQARLYTNEKKSAEREKVLRKVIETIRSSLNIKYVKHEIVYQIGNLLKADRVFFADYDIQTQNYYVFEEQEYRSTESIKSFIGYNFIATPDFGEYIRNYHLGGNDIIFNDLEKYLEDKNLRGTGVEKFYKDYGFISSAAINIYYEEEFLGDLVITFENKKNITEEDIIFLKTLAAQAGVAVKQAELYEEVKYNAKKEKLLREIVSELKPFKNVEDAFNYLLSKIANIYDVSRTVLIEVPLHDDEKTQVGYELIKKNDMPSLKDTFLPNEFLEIFGNVNKDLSSIIVSDTNSFNSNKKLQTFFNQFLISSFIGTPLVRYNHQTRVLGVLVIFDDKPKNWSKKDIELLQSINESVVNVLWEILKTIEVNKLRDTFINTLAHDLQVPIVGDIKALEFLSSRADNKPIGELKNIINETIINDKRILTILKRLLISYNYESGKKELNLMMSEWKSVINNVVEGFNDSAINKLLNIKVEIPENLPKIYIDMDEISIVLYIFIENAIMYTEKGGNIIIKTEFKGNYLQTCVIDNGPGIPEHIKESIFKRYEMAIELERKIGAGISLYLAKQIVDAHGGKVLFDSKSGEGATFCMLLPLNIPEL
ncbi:MAG: MASE3 domain-containing protein [bacterium]